MKTLVRLLLPMVLCCLPGAAAAHTLSDSFLELSSQDGRLEGHWRIAVSDLELAIGLDGNTDGRISWGEIRQRREAINQHVLEHLAVRRADASCRLTPGAHQIINLNAGAFLHIPLEGLCESDGTLEVSYDFLFDIDASHRGLLTWIDESSRVLVFSPDRRTLSPDEPPSSLSLLWTFLLEGIWHIWIGIDHILFLFALLVPIILRRNHAGRRTLVIDILKMVTAFTVAHSITLVIAALGWLSLPARLVESLIALSVAISGINILYPVLRDRHWQIAFGFGLIHGFGFASVLMDLSLPTEQFLGTVLSFNLGVEIGQLAIVLAMAPVLLLLGQERLKARRATLWISGLATTGIGLFWLAERALNL